MSPCDRNFLQFVQKCHCCTAQYRWQHPFPHGVSFQKQLPKHCKNAAEDGIEKHMRHFSQKQIQMVQLFRRRCIVDPAANFPGKDHAVTQCLRAICRGKLPHEQQPGRHHNKQHNNFFLIAHPFSHPLHCIFHSVENSFHSQLRSASSSSGVKVYCFLQKWQLTSTDLPSAASFVSSSLPRAVSTRSVRSRLQSH